jgi:hypothetical protein
MTKNSDLKTILDRIRHEQERRCAKDEEAERNGSPYAEANAVFSRLRRTVPKLGESKAAYARRLAPVVAEAGCKLVGLQLACPLDQISPGKEKEKDSKEYAVRIYQLAAEGKNREVAKFLIAAAKYGEFFDRVTYWLRHLNDEIMGHRTLCRLNETTGQMEAVEESGTATVSGAPRPEYRRDHLWLQWREQGMMPAAIFKKWNAECSSYGGKTVRSRITVSQGISKAKKEREGRS